MVAADCCPRGIDECPGEWPWNYECTAGICTNGGCTSDDDCEIIAGTVCAAIDDFSVCVPLCDADDDCYRDFGETCSGVADDGQMFCIVEGGGCENDEDCGGYGVCDLDTGSCVCDDASVCPEGFACAPWPPA
jgi:hypothetical protein